MEFEKRAQNTSNHKKIVVFKGYIYNGKKASSTELEELTKILKLGLAKAVLNQSKMC